MSDFISLTQAHYSDPLCRSKSLLIFMGGVLVPSDWKIVRAVAGSDGFIERYQCHANGDFVIDDGEIVRVIERGSVSIRVMP